MPDINDSIDTHPEAHEPGMNTLSVHGGDDRARAHQAIPMPIIQAAAYAFADTADLTNFMQQRAWGNGLEGREDYGRYGNPTVRAVERKVAALEGSEDAVLFSSGMAAITSLLLSSLPTNAHIVMTDDCYRRTRQFCTIFLARLGIETTIVPMGALQRTVARRLTIAKTTIPHFYLRAEVRIDALAAMREAANLVLGAKASVNDCIVRAAALALMSVPEVNVQVHDDAIHRFAQADIAVAVASPRGLVTPIVRGAERLRPHEIGAAVRALAARAEAGRLAAEDIEGGSFTVSNLGMFGVD